MKITKKMKRLARISAYSLKAKQEEIKFVEDFKLENAKTKEIYQILKNLEIAQKKVLLLVAEYDLDIVRAGRNIPYFVIRLASEASTYDIIKCNVLLIQKSALDKITEVCKV